MLSVYIPSSHNGYNVIVFVIGVVSYTLSLLLVFPKYHPLKKNPCFVGTGKTTASPYSISSIEKTPS